MMFYKHACRQRQLDRVDHLDDVSVMFTGKPSPNSSNLRKKISSA